MNWPRKVGLSLIISGAICCGLYVVPTVYGAAMSHIAVAEFRAQSQANSLWDRTRFHAYEKTLAMRFPAPEAVLRVPRVGLEVPVLEGTADATLNRGVGHIAGTAMPGEAGNVAITGHRDGFFRSLKDVQVGDVLELALPNGNTARYAVRDLHTVTPHDTSVLAASNAAELTLVTCYPFYYIGPAPERYIVRAELISPTKDLITPRRAASTPTSISGE